MLRLGDHLGEYQVRRLIGRGGMGEVYEAFEPALGRLVALKILPEWLTHEEGALERFQREAATAAQLEHPHIVPIYSWGEADGRYFFTMKLIQGLPLSKFIKERLLLEQMTHGAAPAGQAEMAAASPTDVPHSDATARDQLNAGNEPTVAASETHGTPPAPRATPVAPAAGDSSSGLDTVVEEYCRDPFLFTVRIGQQLADALAYAHQMGQMHRDVKPSNVMIDRHGQIYLIDFGLTRAIAGDATRHRCGTLRYMSPEQLDLAPLDARTDVYSLGVTLYEMLSSQPPFEGADESAIAEQIRTGAVQPLELASPKIPEGLGQVIRRAMHPKPAARFQTAADLCEELAACERELEGERPHQPQQRKRSQALWATAVLLALAVGGAGLWFAWSSIFHKADSSQETAAKSAAAKAARKQAAGPLVADLENSIGMKLKLIPPGDFWMGSAESEPESSPLERPRHKVHITKPFYLGLYEVTQQNYLAVTGKNPSVFTAERLGLIESDDYPVDSVTWNEANDFCIQLSALAKEREAGRRYRLPTEAEWEYACRGGTITPFHFGDQLSSRDANVHGKRPYGGATTGPLRGQPTPVGTFIANAFGLFDMHGNVAEWCHDCFADYTAAEQYNPRATDLGPRANRVMRGGFFSAPAGDCRAARRFIIPPGEREEFYGFRVVCETVKD